MDRACCRIQIGSNGPLACSPYVRTRMLRKIIIMASIGVVILFSLYCLISSDDSNEIEVGLAEYSITPRGPKTTINMMIIGDTGGLPIFETTKVQLRIAKTMGQLAARDPIDMVINLGDNVYYTGVANVDDYRFGSRFENVYTAPSLQVPWLMMAGNHDHFGNITAQIAYTKKSNKWFYPALYYNMTYLVNNTKVEVVVVDTIELCGNTRDVENGEFWDMMWASKTGPEGPKDPIKAARQMVWIEKILNSSDADYLLVAGHYPIHSVSSHGPTLCLHKLFDPLLWKYNVSVYLSGHDHALQHFTFTNVSNHTMHYVVSGAGSRADSSTTYIHLYDKGDHLKFHYPPSNMFSFLHAGQLGFSKGGFISANFGKQEAKMDFYDKKGRSLYSTKILPRYLRCSVRNKEHCLK